MFLFIVSWNGYIASISIIRIAESRGSDLIAGVDKWLVRLCLICRLI